MLEPVAALSRGGAHGGMVARLGRSEPILVTMSEFGPDQVEEEASTRPARRLATVVRLGLYLVALVLLVRVFAPEHHTASDGDDGQAIWLIGSTTALFGAAFSIGLVALIVEVTLRLARRGSTH